MSFISKIKTFGRGGVHPHDYKEYANKSAVRRIVYHGDYVVPLSQHIGAPAECLVQPGDEVQEFQKIGASTGFISAEIHSPVKGVVKELGKVQLPNGIVSDTVVITPDEAFLEELAAKPVVGEIADFNPEADCQALIDIVKDSGIVGMGGATFPLNVKLSVPKGKNCTDLVINGVECEPFLCADHRVMVEYPEIVIQGVKILKKVLSPERIFIGIENNKKDAIRIIAEAAEKAGVGLTVVPLKVRYPQGDEKQLLKAVVGKEIPSGSLPIDIGAVVCNIGTVKAVYEAVAQNRPSVERFVTVSGDSVKNPSNFLVRVGTPFDFLIEEAGGFNDELSKVVAGGPMMGFAVLDTSIPVIKGTSGILGLSKHIVRKKAQTNCLSCGRCVQACPMGLVPSMMYKLIEAGKYGGAMQNNLMDCKECGCCSFVCPAGIPLVQGMKLGKRMGRK